jgi:hypothetical protein
MPFVYATYHNHLTTANPDFEKWGLIHKSSTHALNALLVPMDNALPTAAERQTIIETLGRIPSAKQTQYQAALAYANVNLGLNLPVIPFAYPVNFRTSLLMFEVAPAQWGHGPADNRPDGWFEHTFQTTWDSSSGNLGDMAQTWNQERVTFLHPPAGPPFNHMMAQTVNYTFGTSHSSSGGNSTDNHFFMHPSLMLTYPLVAGIVRAEQAYEYSPDGGVTWYDIPNGRFYFDKGVRNGGGGFVFVFEKRNDAAHNNGRAFHFEVEYAIGPAPVNTPLNYGAVHGRGSGAQAVLATYANVISLS